jgi:hypothetical protein
MESITRSTETSTTKNTTSFDRSSQFDSDIVEAYDFEEPPQHCTVPRAHGNPSSEPRPVHQGASHSNVDSMADPLRQELVRAPLLASYTITEPSHHSPLGQASCFDEHTMAETSYPNPLARAPLLTTYTITEPSHPSQPVQASHLDEHTMAETSYPNPLARAPLLTTYTITEPSHPNQPTSYLDEHTMAETSYPSSLARAPLLTTYTITEPSNANLLADAPLSDSFFTTNPLHMHQSTAAFIRSGNTFPSAFVADDIQAEFS